MPTWLCSKCITVTPIVLFYKWPLTALTNEQELRLMGTLFILIREKITIYILQRSLENVVMKRFFSWLFTVKENIQAQACSENVYIMHNTESVSLCSEQTVYEYNLKNHQNK